jgi:hypothetical protein
MCNDAVRALAQRIAVPVYLYWEQNDGFETFGSLERFDKYEDAEQRIRTLKESNKSANVFVLLNNLLRNEGMSF